MIRLGGVASLVVVAAVLAYLAVSESQNYLFPAAVVTAVAMTGVYDLLQRKHSILRNYPVLGHIHVRSLIYQRAKGNAAEQSYGTERDIDYAGYEYLFAFDSAGRACPRAVSSAHRWPRLQAALRHGADEHLVDELRFDSFAPVSGRARSRVASR